ncbi:hypothetical protein ACJMK2_043548 [Sinanodonta woodiana]|uniref:RRM domain-containing protein n=1 Tax=Sinanodonta woodiana TaxID=1069815 RepID=A0ABD3VYL3_SINWO
MHDRTEAGKLFVGGLSWETSVESLQNYFCQYGEVVDCVVMKNPQTGKSRGFGFVTYKDTSCVETVLAVKCHIIDGRQVDPKACNPKGANRGPRGERVDPYKDKKVFIGGLPGNVDEDYLKEFFSRYGKVIDVTIMFDPQKQRSRGFGFLTFESDESIEQLCGEHYVEVNGKKVECKRAEPREGRRGGGPGGMGMPYDQGPPMGQGGWPPEGGWNQAPPPGGPGPMQGGPGGPPPGQPMGGYQDGYQQQGGWGQPPQQPSSGPWQKPPPQQTKSTPVSNVLPTAPHMGGYPGPHGQPPVGAPGGYQWGPPGGPGQPPMGQPPLSAPPPGQPPAYSPYGQSGGPGYGVPPPGQPPAVPGGPPRPYGEYSYGDASSGAAAGYGTPTPGYGGQGDATQQPAYGAPGPAPPYQRQGSGQQPYHPYRR